VVLDTVKALEDFQGVQDEPEDLMDEEWERPLSRRPPAQKDPEIKSPLEEGPEGTQTSGDKEAPQDPTDI
jgi:hypothetical protein